MENQLIRGQVFDVLFNYAEKWGSICTESDCATVRDEICLRIDQSQFTADEAEDYINQGEMKYWDEFNKQYQGNCIGKTLTQILESFWYYCNGQKTKTKKLMS